MSGIDDILKNLPIDQIASQLGVDAQTARTAIEQGGGAILSGLQKNASTSEGSAAIEAALGTHAGTLANGVDLSAVDTADGEKILGHVFGGNQQEVAKTLTNDSKTAGIDFSQLLPILAPIVMGMLAKNQASSSSSAGESSGGIGDLIGGLLGGLGGQSSGGSSGGFDIGGLIGGLLGGKK
ncbi:DUF937 domain-containing protein [Microbacterium sp.]|uniref:DUF937 domain-containing protein n=1 Tax=Microbacterium sp. TaxID=51671 RepID=UPI0039E543DD